MQNKLLAIALLIIVVVITAIVWTKLHTPAPETTTEISFICEDENHFVARFGEDFEDIAIVKNGVVTEELLKSSDTPLTFSSNESEYVFGGEMVMFKNLNYGETTTCHQPFDPNNAPYNFGEGLDIEIENQSGEEVSLASDIVGSWQNIDDESFVRIFAADNLVTDQYEGEDVSVGTWEIFYFDDAEETEFPQEPDTPYLKITEAEEVMYFTIAELTDRDLELIYMNRGGVLRFTALSNSQ